MKNLKDLFNFSRSEKRGILVLLIILLLVMFIPYIYERYIYKAEEFNYSEFEKNINSFITQKEEPKAKSNYYNQQKTEDFDFFDVDKSSAKDKLNPFSFNPNNLSAEKWKEMGFTDSEISMIKNYELKGGKFYKKEDVKKLYCINDYEYAIIEPFINIPSDVSNKQSPLIINLNTASADDLKKIKGIEDSFSKRIIKYRELLGAYVRKEQLMEVYGMDSVRYFQIIPFVDIDPYSVKKININTADFKQFNSHPYISYNVALSLVNYREMHGDYTVVQDIKNSILVDDDCYNKISPYLTVD